jgi:Cu-Zn family superoxide dismutase
MTLHLRSTDLIRLIAVVGIAASGLALAGCDTADDYETVTETTMDHETLDDPVAAPGAEDPYAPDPAVEGALPGERGITDQPEYGQTPGATPEAMEEERAVAVMAATEGSEAQGEILFTTDVVADSTQITGQLSGLEPGEHGLHVHVVGDCSGKNAEAAGEHFDPAGETGSAPDSQTAAAGEYPTTPDETITEESAAEDAAKAADEMAADEAAPTEAVPAEELQPGVIGTIVANADGTATINLESEMSLVRGPNGIIGRAIVIHFSEDDDPVACGVIQADDQVAQADSETI